VTAIAICTMTRTRRVARAERRGGEDDVADRLGEDPADAEHHARPELRIPDDPGDQLASAAHHLRDEEANGTVVRAAEGEQLRRRDGHRGRVGQSQPDEPALGLVRNRVARELHDDREAEPLRRGGGSRGIVGEPIARDGHAVRRDDRLRGVLGERHASPRTMEYTSTTEV
jgi:hypothetical protein